MKESFKPSRGPKLDLSLIDEISKVRKNAPIPAEGVTRSTYRGWPTATINAPAAYQGYKRHITVIDHTPSRETAPDIENRKRELETYKEMASSLGVPLSKLMSGESSLNKGRFRFETPDAIRGKYPYLHPAAIVRSSGQIHTGRDNLWSATEFPLSCYKFFLALDNSSPEKAAAADAFATELVEICAQKKISIDTKSFDKNYDSYNIYTPDLKEMTELIQQLYPEYASSGCFANAQRYFQAPIEGIDPRQIAWVQEPDGGWGGGSHSTRMGWLGKHIEEGLSYEEACAKIGVRPEAPWLIDEKNPPQQT